MVPEFRPLYTPYIPQTTQGPRLQNPLKGGKGPYEGTIKLLLDPKTGSLRKHLDLLSLLGLGHGLHTLP